MMYFLILLFIQFALTQIEGQKPKIPTNGL
jgi:hypothetical protein